MLQKKIFHLNYIKINSLILLKKKKIIEKDFFFYKKLKDLINTKKICYLPFNIKNIHKLFYFITLELNHKQYNLKSNNIKNMDKNIIFFFTIYSMYKKRSNQYYTKINDYKFYFLFLKKYFRINI